METRGLIIFLTVILLGAFFTQLAASQEYYAENLRLQAVKDQVYAEVAFEGDRLKLTSVISP